ncbi:MAG: hypothetical protein ACFNZS_08175 [Ottowia sp.]
MNPATRQTEDGSPALIISLRMMQKKWGDVICSIRLHSSILINGGINILISNENNEKCSVRSHWHCFRPMRKSWQTRKIKPFYPFVGQSEICLYSEKLTQYLAGNISQTTSVLGHAFSAIHDCVAFKISDHSSS